MAKLNQKTKCTANKFKKTHGSACAHLLWCVDVYVFVFHCFIQLIYLCICFLTTSIFTLMKHINKLNKHINNLNKYIKMYSFQSFAILFLFLNFTNFSFSTL